MVNDVAESVRFYVDKLGFTLDMVVPEHEQVIEVGLKGGKKYSYAMVHRDQVCMMFMQQDVYRKGIPVFATMAIGALVGFYIDMEDVESFYN